MLDFLEEPKQALDLPLDLRGTAFQQRVWRTLCRIPPGETRTYGELARMIGDPRAVRAVARSCARNPVSLAVPCHRVIGSDGSLTGYRWGVPRKRALLEKERARGRRLRFAGGGRGSQARNCDSAARLVCFTASCRSHLAVDRPREVA